MTESRPIHWGHQCVHHGPVAIRNTGSCTSASRPLRTRGNMERGLVEGLCGQYVRPCSQQDLSYFGMPSPHRCVQGGCSLWRTRNYFCTIGQQRFAYICMAGPARPDVAGCCRFLSRAWRSLPSSEIYCLLRSGTMRDIRCQFEGKGHENRCRENY